MRIKKKTTKEYGKLFEDLMEYTDFTSSDEIKTKKNLLDFFDQVKDNAYKKGKDFKVSNNLFNGIADAVIKAPEPIERKVERAKGHRGFKTFASAKEHDFVVIVNNISMYKSFFMVKGKSMTRWRDHRGRFVKTP